MQAVLISNGPGELTTWLKPVLLELRRQRPELHISIVLLPCQFASGNEPEVARSFGADTVMNVPEYLRFAATGYLPKAMKQPRGFVLSLGGNVLMALRLARALGYPTYRYSFVPWWHPRLKRLFVANAKTYRQARRLGAPRDKLELVGNLVADVIQDSAPAAPVGNPHIILMFGSRDTFAVHVIPVLLAIADALVQHYPHSTFVAPISHLLSENALMQGLNNNEAIADFFPEGISGVRQGDSIHTENGAVIQMVSEEARHQHMKAATLAVTIPGTNTLELGIAHVPALVLLPLNKPEVIPLEGIGHWLSLIPFIGTRLKRHAVLLAAPHFPVSLPNHFSGQDLMLEYKGKVTLEGMVAKVRGLLDNPAELQRRKAGLKEYMPTAGATKQLVDSVLGDTH